MIGKGKLVRVETFCCSTVGDLERSINAFLINKSDIEVHDVKYQISNQDGDHFAVLIYKEGEST